ncbi:restriction endonuclease subunit S [Selenomonas montiformis]|uniref:restriction endonuclease subunit S n=1 Tax=Selenomonas montiformis TaxID=2652285 RepID=UPI003F8CDA94
MRKTICLGDMATYINGYAFKPADWGTKGLPIIRIQNLTDSGKDYNYYEGEVKEKYLVRKGDVLISWSASIGVYEWEKEDAWLNQHIFKVVFDKGEVDKRYFKYATGYVLEKSLQYAHGSTMKHLTKGAFDKLPIPIYDLKEQRVIAEKIGKVDEAIFECEAMLADFELLVKSRFIEMFGDPVRNPMNWEKGVLKDITSKIGSGATPKGGNASYKNEGISLIRSMNVHNGYFDYKGLAHIDGEQASLLDNVNIESNDVLLNITGASVARCCVVPDDILPARVNQHVCILRCKDDILPMFLNAVLISDQYQAKLWNIAEAGATRQALSKEKIETFQIILPPISLQKQFANFVDLIDKSKLTIQKSMDNLQELRDSLLQEYFG